MKRAVSARSGMAIRAASIDPRSLAQCTRATGSALPPTSRIVQPQRLLQNRSTGHARHLGLGTLVRF